ncbi:hypothetical protein [Endozoicomonas sp. ALB115]|uniref:hypothetical protein n=1 Tax=Endozoicomonas sp. ALB115 TaxID=3403074 RepID=UPI003BB73EAB
MDGRYSRAAFWVHHIPGFCRFPDGTSSQFDVIRQACVVGKPCQFTCPVDNCITMVRQQTGKSCLKWTQHPNSKGQEGNLSTDQI